MNRIWKDIVGYEGLYQVSDVGNVRSLKYNNTSKTKYMKIYTEKTGYQRVCLSKDGKKTNKRIHRLVAEAFLDNPNCYEVVNHKNGDKTNNKVSNLEWCSRSHNQQHAYDNNLIKKKFGSDHWNYGKTGDLNATSKKVLCVTTGEIFGSAHDASRKYNLNFSNICSCCRGSRNYCGKLNDGTKLRWEYLKAD